MTIMNYIGLDPHKKTISYWVKDASGGSSRRARSGQPDASWIVG
jgi:hypothetical protein